MRNALPTILTLSTIVFTASSQLLPFVETLLLENQVQNPNSYRPDLPHQLLEARQYNPNACPTGYTNCGSIGAPGLCCQQDTRCAADNAGYVACCPYGAVCTGVITALAVSTTTTPQILSTTTVTSNNGLVLASTTTGGTTTVGLGVSSTQGFIIAGSTTVVQGVSGGHAARDMPSLFQNFFAAERTVRAAFRLLVGR